MTPETLNAWIVAVLPILDRVLAVALAWWLVRLARSFPWARAWVFLCAVPAVVIDGATVVAIAMLIFSQSHFGSEEAYKYVHPIVLFWLKYQFGVIAAGFQALKYFRNREYADHRNKQDQLETKDKTP